MSTSSTPSTTTATQPHNLFSLVVQSKKAFQHGEQICFHAHSQSNASAQAAVDVLALDAKVRWVRDAVLEQLKLAASVAKSIEEKRRYIGKQVEEWDTSRTKHTDALDAILEALSNQYVPPDFHQSSSDSSIFGSQHSSRSSSNSDQSRRSPGEKDVFVSPQLESPSATLRHALEGEEERERRKRHERSRWKTLRDFVDDQALEELLETIDNDRAELDNILSKTSDYPEILHGTITSIQSSLPEPTSPLHSVHDTLVQQERIANHMAQSLDSLSSHYDQMSGALNDHEAGEVFSDEDMQDMNRDTEELPLIMAELEESARTIDTQLNHLLTLKQTHLSSIHTLSRTLSDLDELGSIMEEMLDTQEGTEALASAALSTLQEHIQHLEQFHLHYVGFQTAFSKLILEMARRVQYREAVGRIVQGMAMELEKMTDEEVHLRARFNDEYGQLLPEDICLSISNPPTRWHVAPWEGEATDVLPEVEADLVVRAKAQLGVDEPQAGAESL